MVDRLRERFIVLYLLDLTAEEVHCLEQHIKQLRPGLFRDDVHTLFTNEEEQILNPVSHRHQGTELHHRGGALDCVHDPEYLVDTILRECIRLFRCQQDSIQLLQQGVGLVKIHIQDAVVAAAHKNATFSHLLGGSSSRKGMVRPPVF